MIGILRCPCQEVLNDEGLDLDEIDALKEVRNELLYPICKIISYDGYYLDSRVTKS
jgi:hypothetical protein